MIPNLKFIVLFFLSHADNRHTRRHPGTHTDPPTRKYDFRNQCKSKSVSISIYLFRKFDPKIMLSLPYMGKRN